MPFINIPTKTYKNKFNTRIVKSTDKYPPSSAETINGKFEPKPIEHWRKAPDCDCSTINSQQVFSDTTCTTEECYDKRIRSILNKNGQKSNDYNHSYSSYLQNKCKSFNQNTFHFDLDGTVGRPNCPCDSSCDNCKTVIYKRSNADYGKQGAVSSSSRIHRLKYNAKITNEKKYTGGQTQNKDYNINVPCMLRWRKHRRCPP